MKWQKHGVIWKPDGSIEWAKKYATCPTPFRLNSETLRVYIQCRDNHNVGRVGYVDLDPFNPRKIMGISENPALDIGKPGCFDDNGVYQTSVIRTQSGDIYMYYVGFELCHHIRYRLLTGLAVSHDGGNSFTRVKSTPILERSSNEMHFRCGPYVMSSSNHSPWRMWYVAGSEWEEIDGKYMPVYDIRYMESSDGIAWPEKGHIVLPVNRLQEHGFGRPYIVKKNHLWQMFYSIRNRSPCAYRMGYAESKDGINWQRKDNEIGLNISPDGWDSEAIEYAAIFSTGDKTWCLYNGNDFGVTGFGIAELIDD